MKLIQKLERKLSWQRKNFQNHITNNNNVKYRKSKKNIDSTVKVSGTEFSRYIRFNNSLVNTVPINDITYELVDIKPNRFVANQIQSENLPPTSSSGDDYQFSLFGYKETLDMNHIYDDIRQDKRKFIKNKINQDGICQLRNRIRTNPWFNSRSGLNLKPNDYYPIENHYECIDWKDEKNMKPPNIRSRNLLTFDKPLANSTNHQDQSSSILSDRNNRLKSTRFKRNNESRYEQYPIILPSLRFNSETLDNHHHRTKGPKLFSQEMKNYAENNDQSKLEFFSNENCFVEEKNVTSNSRKKLISINNNHNSHHIIGAGRINKNEMRKIQSKKRKFVENNDDDHRLPPPLAQISKKKKVESSISTANILSTRKQSKKIDKLKSELKEIVHVAIQEAKKDSHILS